MIVWLKTIALTLVAVIVPLRSRPFDTKLPARSVRKDAYTQRQAFKRLLDLWPRNRYPFNAGKCFIDISNPGHIASTLRAVHLSAGKLNIIVPPYDGEPRYLPYEILPGQSCKFWVDTREIAQGLAVQGLSGSIKLRGVATDGTGTDFLSDAIDFDIDRLTRQQVG